MATKPPHPVVTKLKAWRTRNSLSQSQAVRILVEAGLPVALTTLQQWEIARSSPRPLMVAAIARFLAVREKLSTTPGQKSVAPVIERLKAWREANRLSQSETVEVLIAAGLPAKLRTLQDWETGRRSPRGLSTSALERFLDEHRRGNHSRCRPLKSFRVVFGSVIPGVTAVTRAFQVCTRTFQSRYPRFPWPILREETVASLHSFPHPLYFVGPILFSSAWAKMYSSKFDSRVAKHL